MIPICRRYAELWHFTQLSPNRYYTGDSLRKARFRFGLNNKNTKRQMSGDIKRMAVRLRDVQLECTPAERLLKRVANIENAIVYADPPYASTDTSPYELGDVDTDQLSDLLLAQKGRVAISGYPGEWDNLGWKMYTTISERIQINGKREPRTTCLWLNYTPPSSPLHEI